MDAATWQRAKDLIGDALELPPSEREAFLASRCTDAALLSEIRTLLRAYDSAPEFLEQPPQVESPEDEGEDLEPGSHIGPYVIVDRLGRGGMGQVFLGNDRRLKRKVALKRLLPSHGDAAEERARVLREARAAARITHPNVAAIHDVIEYDGHVFIVMEYVDGETLAARLRRERLTVVQVISIGRQLTSALAAAHANGIVHRDLKPGNIQVALDGTVKVLDFGIAQRVMPATTTASGQTTTTTGFGVRGVLAGTPAYMSPEQMMGGTVDERSDLFSLGVVLFEMLAGRRPFPDSDPLERLSTGTFVAPRVDTVNRAVPASLADLVAKALEVEPRRRFQSAAEMGAALEAVHEKVAAAAVPSRRSLLLRSGAAIAATLVVLALLGVITTAAFNLSLQRPPRFGDETVLDYLVLGFQSNFLLLIIALGLTILGAAATFLMRMLTLVPSIDRSLQHWRGRCAAWSARLGLDDPAIFGQSLAALGVVGLLGVVWWNRPMILAALQWVSLAAPEDLDLLALANETPRAVYRVSVDLLLLAIGLGAVRLIRLHARHRTDGWAGALGIVSALLAIVMLLHVVPYRLLFQSSFERIEVAGERCYLVSERGNEAFVFCTEARPPRSRVINLDTADLRRSGVRESIFTPPFGPSSVSPQ